MNELIVDAIKDELDSLGWEYEVEDNYSSYNISAWVTRNAGRILILIDVENDKTSLTAIHTNASEVYSNPVAFMILNDENKVTDLKLTIHHDKDKKTHKLWCSSAPILNDSVWADDVIREVIFSSVCTIERCYNHIKQYSSNRMSRKISPPVTRHRTNHEDVEVKNHVSEKLIEELCTACVGDVETVKKLLAVPGIDVNQTDEDGWTPLCRAASGGHTEIVKLLLAHPRIDVNKAGEDGDTPLRAAWLMVHTDIVRLLLAHPSIDVNKRDEYGDTPLVAVCMMGYEEIAKLLLEHPGIDVNKTDKDGGTPLHMAARHNHTEIVKLLLAHPSIDINKTDEILVWTPLCRAASDGHTEIVKLLLAHPSIDVNKTEEMGRTPLCLAARDGHAEVVTLLLATPGIDIDKGDPLNEAKLNGHSLIVSLLQDAATKNHVSLLSESSTFGVKPAGKLVNASLMREFILAVVAGKCENVRSLLLKQGIDINGKVEGITPLFAASYRGYVDIVRLLLSMPNIDVNMPSNHNFTPLYAAVAQGHEEVVNLLLAYPGIDVKKGNPLFAAKQKGYTAIIRILLAAGA